MKYNKILVIIIIIGTIIHAISNMPFKLVVAMEGQVEQEEPDQVITSNIPVQGYIVPKKPDDNGDTGDNGDIGDTDDNGDTDDIGEMEQNLDLDNTTQVDKEIVDNIPSTTDTLSYQVYVSMIVLSLLWIIMIWNLEDKSNKYETLS